MEKWEAKRAKAFLLFSVDIFLLRVSFIPKLEEEKMRLRYDRPHVCCL